uniref:Dynein light chain n=1 Tax=Parascaris equorum TaxID=6256 RepID=A0A914S0E2_PAREQ
MHIAQHIVTGFEEWTFSRALTMMDVAADESKIPCDERRQESTNTKRNADPKVVLVASGMDDEMESFAVSLAIDAIAVFCNEKMKIAKYIASKFEAKYGAPWHCIASDGHMRFYVRYDADDHIFFAVNVYHDYAFILEQRWRNGSKGAIFRYPNEKMIIAHYITTRFAAQYGYEVRHHSEDHIFFSVGSLTILLFREEDVKNATIKSSLLKPRKLSTSMQLPTKIISSCMDMEMQQFAVTVAVQVIEMKFPNERMLSAHYIMRRLESQYGPPWHCVVSGGPLGYSTHQADSCYCYLRIDSFYVFIFQHNTSFDQE